MTIQSINVSTAAFSGNDLVNTFDYDFQIDDESEIVIKQTDSSGVITTLVFTTDYTLTGIGNASGGTFTLTAGALPSGEKVQAFLNLPNTQETDFDSQGAFDPEIHEAALDKLTRINQQQQRDIDRAAKLDPADTSGADVTLPLPSAGKALKWNATGNGLENSTDDVDGITTAAAASASAAAASAAAASSSETNAAGSASAADTSETNAAASETNAAASASAAAASETNAAGSASAAAASETNAAGSASAASTSKTDAAGSASAASTSETNAQISASSAAIHASNASTDAASAAASKAAAATSETNAAASAASAAADAAAIGNMVDDTLIEVDATGLGIGDFSASNPSNALHIKKAFPIITMEDTDRVSTEVAQVFTDANGSVYLSADPTNVNGSSEVRVMDNSLIVARFRSGVGMDLFDDNHRVVIGGDRVQSEIDSYTLNFPTDQTITTTTSSAFHSGTLSHTLQRGDGTSHLEVTMNIGWRTIANSSGHGRGIIEPYYYTGTAYTPIRTALDSAESQQVVGVFSGNANQQNSGRVTIKMILDSSFVRSDVANMITIKMGGQCADSGMSWVTEGVSYYVREVLI